MKSRNYLLIKVLDRKGMTQGALARAINMSETHVSRLILGHSQPNQDDITRICHALGGTPAELGFEEITTVHETAPNSKAQGRLKRQAHT